MEWLANFPAALAYVKPFVPTRHIFYRRTMKIQFPAWQMLLPPFGSADVPHELMRLRPPALSKTENRANRGHLFDGATNLDNCVIREVAQNSRRDEERLCVE